MDNTAGKDKKNKKNPQTFFRANLHYDNPACGLRIKYFANPQLALWYRIQKDWSSSQINRRVNLGSGREDLNLRPPTPEAGALTRLRYAPIFISGKQLGFACICTFDFDFAFDFDFVLFGAAT